MPHIYIIDDSKTHHAFYLRYFASKYIKITQMKLEENTHAINVFYMKTLDEFLIIHNFTDPYEAYSSLMNNSLGILPDIILLDFFMQKNMNGVDFAKKIQHLIKHMYVIMLSGRDSMQYKISGLEVSDIHLSKESELVKEEVDAYIHRGLKTSHERSMLYIDPHTGFYNRKYYEQEYKNVLMAFSLFFKKAILLHIEIKCDSLQSKEYERIISTIHKCKHHHEIFFHTSKTKITGIFSKEIDIQEFIEHIDKLNLTLLSCNLEISQQNIKTVYV
jgi:CheY-like chemotaxis protein